MQLGLAPAIKAVSDIPVFCSFQGEDTFLESNRTISEPSLGVMRTASSILNASLPSERFSNTWQKDSKLGKKGFL